MKSSRSVLSLLLRAAITAVCFGILFWWFRGDWPGVWRVLRTSRLWPLLAGAMLLLTSLIVCCARWHVLLAALEVPWRFWPLLRLYLWGLFFNTFLPGALGGDAVRLIGLGREERDYPLAAASIFAERFTGFSGLVILTVLALPLAGEHFSGRLLLLTIAVALAVYGAVLLFVVHQGVLDWTRPLAARLHLLRLWEIAARFHRYVVAFGRRRGALMQSVLLTVVSYLLLYCLVIVCASAVGARLEFVDAAVIVPVVSLISVLPISLGGWGVLELSFATMFKSAGLSGDQALATALLVRFIYVGWGLVGGLLYQLCPVRKEP